MQASKRKVEMVNLKPELQLPSSVNKLIRSCANGLSTDSLIRDDRTIAITLFNKFEGANADLIVTNINSGRHAPGETIAERDGKGYRFINTNGRKKLDSEKDYMCAARMWFFTGLPVNTITFVAYYVKAE
ncbi:MAG: hypothetical protein ABSA33_03185 [Candidatus Micrarchaeaceae archaeon]|jgi:hypothetical protein